MCGFVVVKAAFKVKALQWWKNIAYENGVNPGSNNAGSNPGNSLISHLESFKTIWLFLCDFSLSLCLTTIRKYYLLFLY